MKSAVAALAVAALGASIANVDAHSWIVCSNYGVENEITYNETNCSGWPRQAAAFLDVPFGTDTGYNSQNPICQVTASDSNYSPTYPMGTYVQGQRVCLTWPSKNHIATTINPYIPDTGVYVLGVPYTGTDPTDVSGFNIKWADFGVSVFGTPLINSGDYGFPRNGFQNCPNFANNNDKSTCSQCFTVANAPPGVYTFQWSWEFNNGTDRYNTCYEINIVAPSSSTPVPPNPPNALSGTTNPIWTTTSQYPWTLGGGGSGPTTTTTTTTAPTTSTTKATTTGSTTTTTTKPTTTTTTTTATGGVSTVYVSTTIVVVSTTTIGACATTTTKATTTTVGGTCSPLYNQCGGFGWSGPTCCSTGTCQYQNPYYSQCLN